MFGIQLLGVHYTNVFCDNESIVKISSSVEYVLNKKHISISYNLVGWVVVTGMVTIGWIDTK